MHGGCTQWRREGGRIGHPPRAALCRGRHLEGRKWNYKILPLLANWYFHCKHCRTEKFNPLMSPNTPRFWDHTPTVSAPRLHTKQCVHEETYTADLTDHSPAVKLYRKSILPSYCFTGNRNSMFCSLFTCFQILQKIENSA